MAGQYELQRCLGALSAGLLLLNPSWTPAWSQGTLDCDAAYGEVSYKVRRQASSSKWIQLTGDSSSVGGVLVSLTSGSGGSHQLKLANARSTDAVYQVIDLGSITPSPVRFTAQSGPLLGIVTHPGASTGLTAKVTVCRDNPPPPPGPKPPAQESGLPLAAAFMSERDDYWAKQPGVAGTLTENCIRQHDTYWTQGPDGKAYPSWHPPVVVTPVETCYFGHEHGDDPGSSPFYVDAKYQAQRDQRVIPIPFGYANEVLAANGGARHEDHFGHKIYRETFEAAYGNSTSAAPVTGTGAVCTALLKLHQGTHGADAITHHLHEAVAHIDCTALPGYAPSRVHVTALVPLGRPGWFSNNCGPYPVRDQTTGTRGTGENNAPSGGHAHEGNPPVAIGGPSRIVDLNSVSEAVLKDAVDGERIIPGASCLRTYEEPGSSKAGKLEFGHAGNDTWVRPLMITKTGDPSPPRMFLKSYYSVFNSARVFWIEADQSIGSRPSVEACRLPPPGGPTRPSALCQTVLNDTGIGVHSLGSPYNGTVRNLNFKSLQIDNKTGSTTIWTDPYGREITLADPSRAIQQYISEGYNGVAGSGIDATIAAPASSPQQSLRVCRTGDGPYPTLPVADACYWDGNNDLLFAKEWWRDYRNPGHRIHAPN